MSYDVEDNEISEGLQDAGEQPDISPSFQQELEHLLNHHSMENDSGTPDFILAQYLNGCLRLYNQVIADRAEWRGESVELPALQAISKELRKKKVPLVVYTNGQRNEIGDAEIEEWPGEIRVSGTITGVLPIVAGGIDPGAYSVSPHRGRDSI